MSLVCLVLLLLQGPVPNQNDRVIEESLNQKYVKNLFWVRDFRSGSRLKFDADGMYVGGGEPGIFGVDGSLQVDAVRMNATRVELRGRRAFLVFDSKSGRLEPFLTEEDLRLEFSRRTGSPIEAAIDSVLLTREELPAALPPYWSRFVTGSGERFRIVDPKTGVAIPTADPSIGMVPGIVKRVAPAYPAEAKRYGYSGSVVARVVVDETGKGYVVDLATPAGFGLEHAAIDAIDRWEFEPARQDGKPVKVYIRVRFDFNRDN